MLENATENDTCFVEDVMIGDYLDKINRITVYHWNRHYPSDVKLDIDIKKCGYKPIHILDFPGKSHEKITKEVFEK